MIDKDPIRTAIRRTRQHARLAGGTPACLLCGYANPVALISVTPHWLKAHGVVVQRSLLDKDHIVGKKHDPELTAPLCRNCHAEKTDGLLQAGVSMRPELDPLARIALKMEAEAVFHEMLAAAKRRDAVLIRRLINPEDRND